MTPYFRAGYRYKPKGLTETERRAKLLTLLHLCQDEDQLTDREAAKLFDAGIEIMKSEWLDKE